MFRQAHIVPLAAAIGFTLFTAQVVAAPILRPGDFIIAIDFDPPKFESSSPAGEGPDKLVDGFNDTKYLNTGKENSGFIVTLDAFNGGTGGIAQSFTLATGNDAEGRDPASFRFYGTNDAITSLNNSTGMAENWMLLDSGPLTLPADRDTVSAPVDVTNSTSFSSYKMIFPTVKTPGGDGMQISELQLFTDLGGNGSTMIASGEPILAIDEDLSPDSSYPLGTGLLEGPPNAVDRRVSTKYLNFGKVGTGLIVSPQVGPTTIQSLRLTTANDEPNRDPLTYDLYGTNDPITSGDNSLGDQESWVSDLGPSSGATMTMASTGPEPMSEMSSSMTIAST